MGQLTRRPRNSPEAILMLTFNPVSVAPFNSTQKLQNSAIGSPCPHSPAFFLRSIGPRMSLTPFGFGPRRSNIFDPFSLDLWDPFEGFPFDSNLSFPRIPFPTSSYAGAGSAFAADTRIDWKETPEAHVFKADLPGLRKEEVKVEVEDGRVLQISGERSREHEEKADTWHRVERSSGRFLRRFRLPENAKVEQVKAAMEDGVLTVTVPKEGVKKPSVKSIEISG